MSDSRVQYLLYPLTTKWATAGHGLRSKLALQAGYRTLLKKKKKSWRDLSLIPLFRLISVTATQAAHGPRPRKKGGQNLEENILKIHKT